MRYWAPQTWQFVTRLSILGCLFSLPVSLAVEAGKLQALLWVRDKLGQTISILAPLGKLQTGPEKLS